MYGASASALQHIGAGIPEGGWLWVPPRLACDNNHFYDSNLLVLQKFRFHSAPLFLQSLPQHEPKIKRGGKG